MIGHRSGQDHTRKVLGRCSRVASSPRAEASPGPEAVGTPRRGAEGAHLVADSRGRAGGPNRAGGRTLQGVEAACETRVFLEVPPLHPDSRVSTTVRICALSQCGCYDFIVAKDNVFRDPVHTFVIPTSDERRVVSCGLRLCLRGARDTLRGAHSTQTTPRSYPRRRHHEHGVLQASSNSRDFRGGRS